MAEGVRIYSQETWRKITDNRGKDLVEKFIHPTVCDFTNVSVVHP